MQLILCVFLVIKNNEFILLEAFARGSVVNDVSAALVFD